MYDLIRDVDEVDDSLMETYHFHSTQPKHDVKYPEVCYNEKYRYALERYVNYLKVLIKTEGFKSSDY